MDLKEKIDQKKKELKSIDKTSSSLEKENKTFTIIATLAGSFVVIFLFVFLIYFFTLKMDCDQKWANLQNLPTCNLIEAFIQNNSTCPQIKEAEQLLNRSCPP